MTEAELFPRCRQCRGVKKVRSGAGHWIPCPTCNATGLEPTAPYQRHSETSKDAAHSVDNHTSTMRNKVLEFIRERGPVTDEVIAIVLGMNPSTVRPRRLSLLRDGLIESKVKHVTHSGRKANAWQVKHG